MAQVQTTFDQLVNFNRGTGATRINAAGLIVGVDFSSSSIAFGTGSKVFTLTADANVSRDWSIGEPVIAVSQATPLGSLTGTVTSYNPVTQELTIEVATSTGTGTATNWRIGSLAVRRDAKGVFQEPQATNKIFPSEVAQSPTVRIGSATVTENAGINPQGNLRSTRVVATGVTNVHFSAGTNITNTFTGAEVFSWYLKINSGAPVTAQIYRINNNTVINPKTISDLNTWVKIDIPTNISGALRPEIQTSGDADYEVALFHVEDINQTRSTTTSYIPTTTVAVTRAADAFEATAETIEAIRQGQGTIIVEAETEDNGLAQKRAVLMSGGTGSIRVAKEGVVQLVSFNRLIEHLDKIVIGSGSPSSVGTVHDGIGYSKLSLLNKISQPVATFNGTNGFASSPNGLGHVGNVTHTFDILNVESKVNNDFTKVQQLGIGGNTVINAAHWTGSQFILPTNQVGTVALSNGDSYRIINDPNITQPCNDATHDPVSGRIVIVGNAGYIGTSDDGGQTWTQKISGNTANISTVEYTGVNFVAKAAGGRPIISTDNGDTFVPRAPGQFLDGGELHFANGVLVSVGVTGDIRYSLDHGETWTAATSNTTVQLNAVTYTDQVAGGLWVACGANGTVLTAVDPTGSWTVYDNTTTPATGTTSTFNAVDYFLGQFRLGIVGNLGRFLFSYDPVGNAFSSIVREGAVGNPANVNGMASGNGVFLLCGISGGIATSTDFDIFTQRTNNGATLNGIAFGNNRFVSVGNAVNGSGYIATIDADGTVTRRVSGTAQNSSNVRFINGRFVRVSTTEIGHSIDGEFWASVSSGGSLTDVAYSPSFGYVATGSNSRLHVHDENFIFVAPNVTPTPLTISTFFQGITFAENMFVAVGTNGVIVTNSDDPKIGSNWTQQTSGTTQTLRSVIYSERDERWYVAGDNGTLLYSDDNAQTWLPVQNASFAAIDNNGVQANPLAAAWQQGVNKIALSYKANEVKLSINGSAPATDTLATIPSITSMLIGDNFNGYIKRLTFKPIAVDPQLETQP